MRDALNISIGLCLLFSVDVLAFSEKPANSSYKITKENIQAHVSFLSSDALEGRLTGTNGEKLATDYVAEEFRQLGLEPAGDNGTFFQEFNFTVAGRPGIKNRIHHGRNVLAKLRVSSTSASNIVVGAHVDHLGYGKLNGSLARDNEKGRIHPGADDNASGVASVLEAAAKLSDLKKQGGLHGSKDILFAAWSGEEIGVLGSSYFMKNFSSKIDAAINLDMVGHLREKLVLQGVGSSLDWSKIIKKANVNQSVSLVMQSDPYLPTDSTPFYMHGVPTLNLFTGAHDNYHRPSDKPETLNYEGIKTISDFLVDMIAALESNSTLAYQEVEKRSEAPERGFRVYLGTIPDYASPDIIGVKLSGVAKKSPAELAGLKQDDVIVELAGKSIHDIYDYTKALNALSVGKAVKLVVLRDNTRLPLTIVARSRE